MSYFNLISQTKLVISGLPRWLSRCKKPFLCVLTFGLEIKQWVSWQNSLVLAQFKLVRWERILSIYRSSNMSSISLPRGVWHHTILHSPFLLWWVKIGIAFIMKERKIWQGLTLDQGFIWVLIVKSLWLSEIMFTCFSCTSLYEGKNLIHWVF